jgi:hypothetical protein
LYDYGDCGTRRSSEGDLTLAWFAAKSGDATFFEKDRFLRPPERMGTLQRYAGIGVVWLSQFEEQKRSPVPCAWAGRGINPVAVFRDGFDRTRGYYVGAKGGCGSVSHGNMDAGSFVFDLDGVRWSVEVGRQGYYELEKTGFNLWDSKQTGDRWKLLSKNNHGHSTLTVNGAMHVVNGKASLLDFKAGDTPEATIDLSPAFGPLVSSATRRFVRDTPVSLSVRDTIVPSGETELITWQLITVADVEPMAGGAILRQEGRELKLEIVSHPDLAVSVVSLNPPPFKLDSRTKGLKRVEVNIPAGSLGEGELELEVRLAGPLAE